MPTTTSHPAWQAARQELDGLPGGRGLNIAHEAADRHAAGPRRDQAALRFLARGAAAKGFTYGELATLTNRFANVLRGLGVRPGERVMTLAGRLPELYVTALGTLKNRSVYCPLFASFGPEPVRTRLELGEARVLVTTETLYRRKVEALRGELSRPLHVILVAPEDVPSEVPGTHDFHTLLREAGDDFEIPPTDPEDPALLHFTSGTTGVPKGAVHVHEAVVAHAASGRAALDLRGGDVYWCTADPGWVTGVSYGIVSPLVCGATAIVDQEELDVERWYDILEQQRVEVWYTAPTAIRMLMKLGTEPLAGRDFGALRFMASVGEPLNPEAVRWGDAAFGRPFHDTWWQTETGAIMIAALPGLEVRPGSMGRPLPGVEAAIVRRLEGGEVEVVGEPGVEGDLALRAGWPSMFREYLNAPERYHKCFAGDWYLTGDLARRDADGYFWFVGRSDDAIKSAGHLIGPFEVESVLLEHPAVAEAGVIGRPDEVAGEVVKAFVSLKAGFEPSPELERDLRAHARKRLGPAVAPREIEFKAGLPKTRSGKIMRRLLKAWELGLEEGDTSTLENGTP